MAKFTKSNHSILKYGSGATTEVDFEGNQSMGGSKITGAQSAVLDHDYITKNQLDTHNHDTVYAPDHVHTVWTPHTHPYSSIDHVHSTWPGNYGYNGYQKLPNGLWYMWGVTSSVGMSTPECEVSHGQPSTPPYSLFYSAYRWISDSFFTLPGYSTPGFPSICYTVNFTVVHAEGTIPYASASTPHPKDIYYTASTTHRQADNCMCGLYSLSKTGFSAGIIRILTDPFYTYTYDRVEYLRGGAGLVRPDGNNHDYSTKKVAVMWLAIGK